MTDIFDNKILCGKCNTEMKPFQIHKNGFILRAVKCDKCSSRIIHPKDEEFTLRWINDVLAMMGLQNINSVPSS